MTAREKEYGARDVMPFGKHKGESLRDVCEYEPGYILWLHREKVLKISRRLRKLAEEIYEDEAQMRSAALEGCDWHW